MPLLVRLTAMLLLVAGCSGTAENEGLTARQAIERAEPSMSWAPDAVLFAVVGTEYARAEPPPTTGGPQTGKPGDLRQFPCGSVDPESWAIMDLSWAGPADVRVGDGKLPAWSAVYYGAASNTGTGVLVRPDRVNECAADPITAEERPQLDALQPIEWKVDSTAAISAVRADDSRINRALSASKNAEVSYGVDLRQGPWWGIKGRAPDEGLSFTARVDLETGAVSDVVVTIE